MGTSKFIRPCAGGSIFTLRDFIPYGLVLGPRKVRGTSFSCKMCKLHRCPQEILHTY